MAGEASEQEQGLSSSIAFQAYAFFLTMLGVLVQLKFHGNSASLFEKHNAIIYSFVVVISIFTGTIILGKKFEMKTIEPIRRLSGAMAPILLLLILVPIFGWLLLVLWIFFAAKKGWDYLQQLYLKFFCEASDGPRNPPEEGSQKLPVQSPSPPSEAQVLWIFFAAKMGWDYLQQVYLKFFCEASDGPRNPPEEGSQELPVQSPSPPSVAQV